MSMKSRLGMYALIAGIMGGDLDGLSNPKKREIDFTPKQPPTPKGCKEYHFNKNGYWWETKKEDTVFSCIAISRKSAERKFNKFISNQ